MRASIKPIRTCIGCRKSASTSELLRVNLHNAAVVPVLKRKAFGRGAWLHMQCGFTAIERKAFRWAFKLEQVPDVKEFTTFLKERLTDMDAKDMKLK